MLFALNSYRKAVVGPLRDKPLGYCQYCCKMPFTARNDECMAPFECVSSGKITGKIDAALRCPERIGELVETRPAYRPGRYRARMIAVKVICLTAGRKPGHCLSNAVSSISRISSGLPILELNCFA